MEREVATEGLLLLWRGERGGGLHVQILVFNSRVVVEE